MPAHSEHREGICILTIDRPERGLVNRVVPTGTGLAAALELAEAIASRDPAAGRASVTLARAVTRGHEDAAWASCASLAAGLAAGTTRVST